MIPGGVNSPVRAFFDLEITPLVVERAFADTIVDVDGNSYIDYCMSWGAHIHGHIHPEIMKVAIDRAMLGTSYGATTPIEGELARKITTLIPSCEKVRIVASGTEATMTAARVARGYTGRALIIKFSGCYHGHADFFLMQAGSGVTRLPESSSAGIPPEILHSTLCLPYNDMEAFDQLLDRPEIQEHLAAVIIEPVACNMGLVQASKEFLELIRRRTEEVGALLIFDEVISGFRVSLGGAQELYGITPDLSCFGKVIGGGFPAAGFGGKAKIMDYLAPLGPVYQAGTLSGNPMTMQAGLMALTMLEEEGFFETLEKKTKIITEPLQELLQDKEIPFCLQECGSLFTIFSGVKQVANQEESKMQDVQLFKKLFFYMFDNGVYMPPSPYEAWFVSMAHTVEHLEKTRDLLMEFVKQSVPNTLSHFAVL